MSAVVLPTHPLGGMVLREIRSLITSSLIRTQRPILTTSIFRFHTHDRMVARLTANRAAASSSVSSCIFLLSFPCYVNASFLAIIISRRQPRNDSHGNLVAAAAGISIQIKYLYTDVMSRQKKREQLMIDWQKVGQRIRELRGFDTTQSEFARRVGVSQSYISSAEHGESEVGAEVLLRISRECKKSIEWLLTGRDSRFSS